jgi:predicted metal-dependent enzyme (double-stranded beta helix superfamily)
MSNIDQNKWEEKYDALSAAPASHKTLFENEMVRVVEVVIEPGQKEPMHHHKWPSVMVVDHPTNLKYYNEKNEVFDIANTKQVTKVEWMDPEPMHAVKNTDSSEEYHAIRIELKQ